MRNFDKIKLNQFDKDELERRKMNALKGGCQCTYGGCGGCACDAVPLIAQEGLAWYLLYVTTGRGPDNGNGLTQY